jgi:hypothetical protein
LKLGALAEGGGALARLEHVQADLEQGGLADAVAADDAGALAGAEDQVEVTEQPAGGSFGADVEAGLFQFDDGVAEARGWRDEEVHLALFGRGLDALDLVELFEPVARLGGACLDAGTHPVKFLAEETLAAALGLGGDLLADGLGFEVGGVVAGVRVGLAVRDLDDPCGDQVEEVAVVGDEDDGAGVALEEALQPADRVGVEVVGRFVEEQQVRLRGECAADGDAAFFTAGERAGFGFERRGAECVGERLDAGVEVPAVGVVDQVEQVGELGLAAVAAFVASDRLDDVGGSGGDVFVDRFFRIEFELLGEVADAEFAAGGDFARVGSVGAAEDFQQRCLAAAVAPDEPDFFARGDGQGDSVEEDLVAVGETDLVGG